jgi:negative regulator of sigma-B (phosphoserine phosphatase)
VEGLEELRLLEFGIAGRAVRGEAESGDVPVVAVGTETVLVAAVDGLGHGFEAAHAAAEAVRALEQFNDEPLEAVVHRCHARLLGSRGVALSLASFRGEAGTMSWLGVGTVAGRLFRSGRIEDNADEFIVNFGGIVGDQLPELHATAVPVSAGDLLVFATDGIEPEFGDRLQQSGTAQEIADRLLREHRRGSDDALVVVARYRDSDQ